MKPDVTMTVAVKVRGLWKLALAILLCRFIPRKAKLELEVVTRGPR